MNRRSLLKPLTLSGWTEGCHCESYSTLFHIHNGLNIVRGMGPAGTGPAWSQCIMPMMTLNASPASLSPKGQRNPHPTVQPTDVTKAQLFDFLPFLASSQIQIPFHEARHWALACGDSGCTDPARGSSQPALPKAAWASAQCQSLGP